MSPFEDDSCVIPPTKRFRGLAGSSRTNRSTVEGVKRKRRADAANKRCAPQTKQQKRELRPLRSDASVELSPSAPVIGPELRARIAANWLSSSHHRLIRDNGLDHWRSGQADTVNETDTASNSNASD